MKTCTRCGLEKERDEFHARAMSPDGLTAACRECRKIESRQRYEANREAIKSYSKKWASENPDRVRELRRLRARTYYAVHGAEKMREWRRSNPDKRRESDFRRRSRKADAPGFATAEQITARIQMYGGRCWMCGAPHDSIDHVIPLARGGSNWPANLRPACRSCNSRKGARVAA